MEFHCYAIGGHKNAVALKEVQHDAFSEEHSAAVHAEKRMKTVAPGLEISQFPIFSVQ